MQRALHAFVDRELRPSDLMALVRTGGAGGGGRSRVAVQRIGFDVR